MRKTIFFLILSWVPVQIFGDVNYIDITKITDNNELVNSFAFIRGNKQCYDHLIIRWDCETPREEMLEELQGFYKRFSALPVKNEELFLLLGDISSYIYNLSIDDTLYYDKTVGYFKSAQDLNPDDYRVYWFLGRFYATENNRLEAVSRYFQAEKLLPFEHPSAFWDDYAYSMYIANKLSHCIRAMDMAKYFTGNPGRFEQQYGESVNRLIVEADKDQSYAIGDIWTNVIEKSVTFTSRPMGIKIMVDSTWKVSVKPYQDHQSGFGIYPPVIMTKEMKQFSPIIGILIKSANDGDNLNDYISGLISKYKSATRISYMNKYPDMVAYEVKDSTYYPEHGGAHHIVVGIERNAPKYPGLLLEDMAVYSDGSTGEPKNYSHVALKDRFRGRMFYTILLDTSEDIFDESFRVFKRMYDDRIIIE
jgi:hypothetical protein